MVIDIVDPIGIELDLVVVEVEVRAVRPVAIGVPVLLLDYLIHRGLNI